MTRCPDPFLTACPVRTVRRTGAVWAAAGWVVMGVVLWLTALVRVAVAQSPPLDNQLAFFVGEWSGAGPQNAFCLVRLQDGGQGQGQVMVDAGSGDWSGARIRWQNKSQSLVVLGVQPWPERPLQRLHGLTHVELVSGFNGALTLRWGAPVGAQAASLCHLQRTTDHDRRLAAARLLMPTTAPESIAR